MNNFIQKKEKGIKNILFSIALIVSLLFVHPFDVKSFTITTNGSLIELLQSKKVTVNMTNKPIRDILISIQTNNGINFIFSDGLNPQNMGNFTLNVKDVTIEQALIELFDKTKYTYKIVDDVIVISERNESKTKRTKERININGKIINDKKEPMAGVIVLIINTTQGTISDAEGRFNISASVGDQLEISFVGYKAELRRVEKDTKDMIILLKQETVELDDVVITAYGQQQRKESLVGAVSTVNSKQLKSSSSDLTTMLAGNIAGVIGWQTGGIPGALTEDEMNTKFYIRGITSFQSKANIDPLILLDGVESSKLDLARIDPEDIESFSVLKDASATAMYGARGANGVIYVTTKKGQSGSVYTSARYESVISMPTREIDVINPIEYMKLYNTAHIGRNPYSAPLYTKERIENTGNPNIPSFVNPHNDWYDIMFKPLSVNHRLGVNVRGGSEVVQYYASVNYNQDKGMLKTDRLNEFKVNINNQGFNLRVNLNIDLKKGIKMVFNSFSTLDKYHGPLADVKQAYYMAFKASPVDFSVTYPADDYYKWNHIRFGGSESSYNPYAKVHEGYTDRMRYSTINKLEYIQNLSFIAKGLELRANASLRQEGLFSSSYTTSPYYYALGSYDYATGKHSLLPINGDGNRVLDSKPKAKSSTGMTQMGFDVRLMHSLNWGKHQTSAMAIFNVQEERSAMADKLFNSLPKRNISLSANAMYGYCDKYFVQGGFAYNGSERFSKDKRMGFFPAFGGSWVISKEDFMGKGNNKIIPFLKVRASWGKVGNDGIIKDPRFVHLSTITLAGVSTYRPDKIALQGYLIENYADPNVMWEISEQLNIGIDTKLFKGLIECNVDFYREKRHNVLDYRTTIPATMGLTMPAFDNVGRVEGKGVDLTLKYQHAFNNDTWLIVNGTFTYNKAKFLYIEEATNKPDWQKKIGREISQQYGYIDQGLFIDDNDINSSPFQGGEVMPGDIKYKDINRDNKVDVYDAVPIGFPTTPRIIYGFNIFLNYKRLEFSFAFQGMGQRAFFINPQSISPFHENKAVLRTIADDHWSPQDMRAKPFWPRLSTSNIIEHNPQENYSSNVEPRYSTYFMNDGQFLRCKSIELGYNIPEKAVKKIGLKNIKVYIRTNNPFIITPFKPWDIELGGDGFNYPIQKTYSAGINVSF